jgi:transcriptional regulator with XRE-family HTH domain
MFSSVFLAGYPDPAENRREPRLLAGGCAMPRNSSRSPESDPAALIGMELARIRAEAGYPVQAAFAAALGYERTVISKAESGDRPPTTAVFTAWMDACGVTGTERAMLERQLILARNARGAIPGWFTWWIDVEKQADSIRVWCPLLIPGLLQIEEYIRALYLLSGVDEDEADEKVAARLERQAIVDGDDPVHLTVLIAEPVLHVPVGAAAVMIRQLEHLLTMSRRRNVILQIVRGAGGLAGMFGAFDIAGGPEIPDTMRMEAVEDQTTDSREMVRQAAAIFEQVRGRALNVEESRAVIVEAIERWKREQ